MGYINDLLFAFINGVKQANVQNNLYLLLKTKIWIKEGSLDVISFSGFKAQSTLGIVLQDFSHSFEPGRGANTRNAHFNKSFNPILTLKFFKTSNNLSWWRGGLFLLGSIWVREQQKQLYLL